MTTRPPLRILRDGLAVLLTAAAMGTLLVVLLPAPRSGHAVGVTIGCAAQAAAQHAVTAGCEGTP
jgi:hypothetical protein